MGPFNIGRDELQDQAALPTVQVVVMLSTQLSRFIPNAAIAKIMTGRDPSLDEKLQRPINRDVADGRQNKYSGPHHIIDGYVTAAI